MNDQRTKKHVSREDDTFESLSTADLAGAGEYSPRSDIGQPRSRFEERRTEDREAPAPVLESPIEIEEADIGGDVIAPDKPAPGTRPGPSETRSEKASADPNSTHAGAAAASAPAIEHETGPLFIPSEANELRSRWDAIQVGFVDEPRRAVEQADNLVAGTMKRLAEIFADERSNLEKQWDRGEHISTEDLRLALRRYRSFFGRLLSV